MVATRFVVAMVALFVLGFSSSAVAQEAPKRSVTDGVYTTAEADRGQAAFEATCSVCHRAEWFGGPEFREHWGWGELFWVYDFVRTNMPYERGGELPPQTYRDLIAYVLKLNGYPAGQVELPRNDEGWMEIAFPELKRLR